MKISQVSKILYKRRLWENPLFSGCCVVSSGTRMETQKAACSRDLSRPTTLVIRNGVLIHELNQGSALLLELSISCCFLLPNVHIFKIAL